MGARKALGRGSVVGVDLGGTRGHEQQGMRPCVVVSDPAVASEQRYPLICVVPITGTAGEGALYPELHPGSSGLTKISYALIDQVRSVDKTRLLRLYGTLSPTEMESLDNGLIWFLGLAMRLR